MSHVIYKTSTWEDAVRSYRSCVHGPGEVFRPMLVLLEQIALSRYAAGLYGNKSMWDLLIVQTQEYDPFGEILHISYDPAISEFTFELQETASSLYKRWTRKCPPDRAFQTFERFLRLKKWFVEEKKLDI